jgi:hypothetical protein
VKFEWVPGVSGPHVEQPPENSDESPTGIYLHLSCDNYEPDLLLPDDLGNFSSIRMVPPGSHKYYFSVKDKIY